jgi:hypothetical protein
MPNQCVSQKSVQFSSTLYIDKVNSAVYKNLDRYKLWSITRRIATIAST